MERCLIAWFHEIALKGKNRRFFEDALRENVKKALRGIPHQSVARLSGRVVVGLPESSDLEKVQRRISRVFGLACYAVAWRIAPDLDRIEEQLWGLVEQRRFETFKIHSRRTPRSLPFGSTLVNNRLGEFIRLKSGKKVQLKDPDLTCYVEFVHDQAFLYFVRLAGAGGLPARTSGRVVALLSGGIDSPVAAYKLMKRGCRAIFVHFHSYPHTSLASQENVRKLVRILNRYQYHSTLYLVPFADCQRQIVAFAPPDSRVILYRRIMMRIADRIAWRKRAAALVTGDSLGQVASQTLDNLSVISTVTKRPILRPLIGDDKEEIIALARRIETYETSILPDEDCCTLFVPKHPAIRARASRIEKIESQLEVDEMVRHAVGQAQVERFGMEGEQ